MEEDDCARTEASSSRAITKTRDIHTDSFLTGAREVVLRGGGGLFFAIVDKEI